MQFSDFDPATFLRDYWQKKPLLIRNPWAEWVNPMEPDDLAGLACETGVESRLITQAGGTWALEHGPLREDRFGTLGSRDWTLLVQAVDHYVDEVAALIAPFRFIPNWRIDDVMVSYAADNGGVGPHFDQYDVFLVQGLGQRRWQIGAPCQPDALLLPNEQLRLLADFEPVEEWVLGPGDILYVPPLVPHNGVAVGDDCMTYSVGFRAPSSSELIAAWCDDLLEALPDSDHYADPDLAPQDNPGEISPAAIARLHGMITQQLLDRDGFARWFGQFSSTPKYPDQEWQPEESVSPEDVRAVIAQGLTVTRNPASRFAYVSNAAGDITLFVDGAAYQCEGPLGTLAQTLCAQEQTEIDTTLGASEPVLELIGSLYNAGSLTFEQDG